MMRYTSLGRKTSPESGPGICRLTAHCLQLYSQPDCTASDVVNLDRQKVLSVPWL